MADEATPMMEPDLMGPSPGDDMEAIPAREYGVADSDPRREREEVLNVLYRAICVMVCFIFWIVFIPAFIIILLALYYLKKKQGCGIPLMEWFIIEYTLTILKFFGLLFLPCFVHSCITRLPHYAIFYYFTFAWIQVIWMIYGYSIYFSDDNNCAQNPDTYGWTIFFIILLFIGLFFIIGTIIYSICCCCLRDQIFGAFQQLAMQLGPSEEDRQRLSKALNTVIYNPQEFEKDQCCICMYEFKESQENKIVKLKCGHAFHYDCIKDNIVMGSANATKCPMCRQDID
jgi:hypothetical protein